MKRILLTVLLTLCAVPAFAQNTSTQMMAVAGGSTACVANP